MGIMFDTVNDPRQTFAGLKMDAVAAYANGKYANFKAAKREFPKTHVIEIDVTGEGIGNCGDFEEGDIPYSRAGAWAKQRLAAGVHRPIIYFSASRWGEIMASLKAAGVSRKDVRIWTAHYTGKEHICSPACPKLGITGKADATQWGSPEPKNTLPPHLADRHLDVSKTGPGFFDGKPGGGPRKAMASTKGKAMAGMKGKAMAGGVKAMAGGTKAPMGKGKAPMGKAKAMAGNGGAMIKRVAESDKEKAVHRPLSLSTPYMKGPDVLALQKALKGGLNHYKVDWLPIATDGEYGPQTVHAAAFYGWILGITEATRRKLRKQGVLAEPIQEVLRNPEKRGEDYRERAEERKERLKKIRKAHKGGPKAAVTYAKAMVGVTEDEGRENAGGDVMLKGKKGGVTFWEKAFGQEATLWCLCFAGYCVRDIGGAKVGGLIVRASAIEAMAKAHSDGWVEVPKSEAKPGDIMLYSFDGSGVPNHGELNVGPLKEGMYYDIGGNTTPPGGDGPENNGGGVYEKLRDPSLLTCVARPLY
jgi:hypothetical protein